MDQYGQLSVHIFSKANDKYPARDFNRNWSTMVIGALRSRVPLASTMESKVISSIGSRASHLEEHNR